MVAATAPALDHPLREFGCILHCSERQLRITGRATLNPAHQHVRRHDVIARSIMLVLQRLLVAGAPGPVRNHDCCNSN